MSPRISELPRNAELLTTLRHNDFKGFAREAFKLKSRIKPFFWVVILLAMAILGAVLSYSITRGFTAGDWSYLWQFLAALVANSTIILVIHEGLHGLAYKLQGAQSVYFGAELKKLTVYAASDEEIFDGKAFNFVAWLPFAVISPLLILGALLAPDDLLFFGTAFAVHSFMCQGDFALILYMKQYDPRLFLTYDSRARKESYFYLVKEEHE